MICSDKEIIMGITSYAKVANNKVYLDAYNLPDKVFIDAVKMVDVIKFRLTDSKHIRNGEPDVSIIDCSGYRTKITRRQLVQNFRYTNGKKIILAFLKNNTDYTAMRNCSENYKVFRPSDKYVAIINGKRLANTGYLACKIDENGAILRDTMGVVSNKMFHKCFRIPLQDVIKRCMNGKNIPSESMEMSFDNTGSTVGSQGFDSSQLGLDPSSFNRPTYEETKKQEQQVQRAVQKSEQASKEETKYLYTVTAQAVEMKNNNHVVGYILKEIKTGRTRQVNTSQLAMVCDKKLVDNVSLVTKENGGKFLRGNGIVLTNLPKVLV